MNRLAQLVWVLAAAMLIPAASGAGPSKPPRAPAFAVKTIDGRTLASSALKGNVVLVDFWATWCEPCRTEIPAFVALQKRYGPKGLQIVGISLDDDVKTVRAFYQRFQMNYPVALGNAALAERFGGVLGLPVAFLIDRDGNIRARHVGQTDAAVFEKEIKDLLEKPSPRS